MKVALGSFYTVRVRGRVKSDYRDEIQQSYLLLEWSIRTLRYAAARAATVPPSEPGTKRMIYTTLMSAFTSSRQVKAWLSFKRLVVGCAGQGRRRGRHSDG